MATVLCTGVQPVLMQTRKLILEGAGHTVIAAHNAEEIMAACTEFLFDVAVIGQSGEGQTKRHWAVLVRQQCPKGKVLELFAPNKGVAVQDADDWLEFPAIPKELAARVAVLAGKERHANS